MTSTSPRRRPSRRAAALGVDVRPVPRISIQAFCESPDVAGLHRIGRRRPPHGPRPRQGSHRRPQRRRRVLPGGGHAQPDHRREPQPPRDRLEADLERLAEVCDPGTKVVVIGQTNDVELYRGLIQRGVSEYLVAPVDKIGIIRAISDLYVERTAQPLGRTIAFVGGKGGVGSSTIAHNVAWAIARCFESDVVIADFDLAFGTAGLDFNQDPTQGIAEAVNAPDRLDDNFLERLLAKASDHVSLLAAPATLDRTYDFGETVFEQVIDVAQASVPGVILDLPHMLDRVDAQDAALRRRDRAHRRARPRQPAQRQEPRRSAARSTAPPTRRRA